MDLREDPGLVKTLISATEYERLLHIESKYTELEKSLGVNQRIQSESYRNVPSSASSQIGGGELTNFFKKLPDLTFDFLIDRGIYALDSHVSNSFGSAKKQFSDYLSKSLIERFGIPPIIEQGNLLIFNLFFIYKRLLKDFVFNWTKM